MPQPPDPPVSPEPAGPPEGDANAQRPNRRPLFLAVCAVVVVLVAAGVTLALTHGSSTPKLRAQSPSVAPASPSVPQTVIPTQTVPQTTTPQTVASPPTQIIGPTYNWLGMQITDTSSGLTVATVAAGSAADTAGVNPGDVIESINATQIGSLSALLKAAGDLKLGNRFQLSVDRGSTPVTMTPTLTGRPTRQS
jgi:membrane-associated protease RseP (regulator of RpoE activity)